MTDSLNRKRQISDPFQREAEQIMKRCQRGTRNYEEANNLHAACYAIIGKLLAQPEQEPVAWGNFKEDGTLVGLSQHPEDQANWTNRKPLYTTPPQRTWVGLTDEDVNGFVGQYWGDEYMKMRSMVRAIEAKLKEKNT